ncbi:hypothetical protein [Clostridium luticellarii]|jgi:hypothetical protein|uniref:Uncharacterized protein n=1 Tax=Clostridium luticellarii TaxID=1691940 RepID=A0A2T0BLV5_9CLOT|nr:hypothetical protein [Clostridium luticellarii]MCI1945922.1 hypothetical protein [Clostridium luticellarii]MCI1969284.1 hypothetical protein [Clostridium luticellarii]MCI1996208.1 hypothetical protein [Clostridium luticellarii]MCI2040587.1 hypothetical protein [Clostridium luticellarii]PRR84874.1 hypothetical protein CLLU_21420 [Clostridium luticellarii]
MFSSSGNPTMYIGGKPKGNYTNISAEYMDRPIDNNSADNSQKNNMKRIEKQLDYKYKKDKHLLIYELGR